MYSQLAKLAVNGIVTINDDLYMDSILRGTRDFDAFLLFTTLGNRYHCTLCGYILLFVLSCSVTNREYAMVAKAYDQLPEKAEKNVLFIRIPIDTAPKVFQFHNINSAPIITFLAGSETLGKKV